MASQTNPTLKIDQVQVSDSGTYKCVVTWGLTAQSAETTVTVQAPTPTPTPTATPAPAPRPVHEHDYGPMQSDPTWHYRECKDGDGAKAEIAEHTPSDWIVIEKATTTKAGSKRRSAPFAEGGWVEENPGDRSGIHLQDFEIQRSSAGNQRRVLCQRKFCGDVSASA